MKTEEYKTRTIQFQEWLQVGDWQVKVYTISRTSDFNQPVFYKLAMEQLPAWLTMKNGFNSSHEKVAFLILHSGEEGIFSIINWWVGKNMLNTHIFITNYLDLREFRKISGDGLAPCVWELEVINHERCSWMEHVLKQSGDGLNAYLSDVMEKREL